MMAIPMLAAQTAAKVVSGDVSSSAVIKNVALPISTSTSFINSVSMTKIWNYGSEKKITMHERCTASKSKIVYVV